MKHFSISILVVLMMTFTTSVFAETDTKTETVSKEPAIEKDIVVSDAYAFATSDKQKNGAVFFIVSNVGNDHDRLIGAKTDVAEETEIHTMDMEDDVMKMRKIDGVDIPLGNTIGFTPNGFHVMLLGLEKNLESDESFTLNLLFEKAGEIETVVNIKAPYTPPTQNNNDNNDAGLEANDEAAPMPLEENTNASSEDKKEEGAGQTFFKNIVDKITGDADK